jgi:hypothetical protein
MVHMKYEVDAMVRAARALSDGVPARYGSVFVESLLLHVRNLAAFLVWPADDVVSIRPVDFGPDWTPAPPLAVSYLLEQRHRLYARLAHLTWQGRDEGERGWQFVRLTMAVLDVCDQWVVFLRRHHANLAAEFETAVHDARRRLTGF